VARPLGPAYVRDAREFHARLNHEQADAILRELAVDEVPRSRVEVDEVASLIVVRGVALACLIGGLALLRGAPESLIGAVPTIALLTVGWCLRPRLRRRPRWILNREHYPSVYELADAIADALGACRVAGIGVHLQSNASFVRTRLRRRRGEARAGRSLHAGPAPDGRPGVPGRPVRHAPIPRAARSRPADPDPKIDPQVIARASEELAALEDSIDPDVVEAYRTLATAGQTPVW
jgi:hypothetical protein